MTAMVSLNQLTRNNSINEIECPGDMIRYNCSVQSNSENVQLTWHVTLPGMMFINITYDETSNHNAMDSLEMNIITALNVYENERIESSITFTLLMGLVTNGTVLECMSEGLDADSVVVIVMQQGADYDLHFCVNHNTVFPLCSATNAL